MDKKVPKERVSYKERARQLKTDIPAVFIAMKRKDTPIPAKIMAAITVIYALSPIDLIPDFIPVLGYLDDIILLPAFVSLTIRLIPKQIWMECREEAKELWKNGKPKKWYYALPIVVFWVFIVWKLVSIIL